MSIIGKFIVTGLFSGLVLSVISIAWPKITLSPRPQSLQQIHDVVKDTHFGKQTSQVLGVSDESKIETINTHILVGQLQSWASNAIANRAQQIVTKQAINQIQQGFDGLNDREKAILQEVLCKPATPSGSN